MLFNKSSNGAAEVKKLLGFIQASVSFANMQTYIALAERDIKRLISKAVFDIAQEHYDSDLYEATPIEPTEENPTPFDYSALDDLVHKIQLSNIFHAYRRYVPSLDVSHSDVGRRMTVSDTEKQAFEWLIDKDDKNILSLAYEADEILLEFLDENIPAPLDPEAEPPPEPDPEAPADFGTAWGNSDAYKLSKALFINTALEFDDIFPIDKSRRLFLSIIPIIREIEVNYIKPCLKASVYTEIKEQILARSLSTANAAIVKAANVPLALYVMTKVYVRFSLKFLPEGIFQNYVTGTINSTISAKQQDKMAAIKPLERDAEVELKSFQQYLARLAAAESETTYTAPDPLATKLATDKFLNL